jgi:putative tryptophan/tyrosine transport system substrate-binding protein
MGLLIPPNRHAPILGGERAVLCGVGDKLMKNQCSEADLNSAFETFVQLKIDALLVGSDVFLTSHRDQVVALAAHHRIPTFYPQREYVLAGGRMSYAPNLAETYRQAGIYVALVLKGAKPSDLPVVQPTKFDFLINLKAAKTLGLEIPPTLLARADDLIEWAPANVLCCNCSRQKLAPGENC